MGGRCEGGVESRVKATQASHTPRLALSTITGACDV